MTIYTLSSYVHALVIHTDRMYKSKAELNFRTKKTEIAGLLLYNVQLILPTINKLTRRYILEMRI
jgi:hypothetical protein